MNKPSVQNDPFGGLLVEEMYRQIVLLSKWNEENVNDLPEQARLNSETIARLSEVSGKITGSI